MLLNVEVLPWPPHSDAAIASAAEAALLPPVIDGLSACGVGSLLSRLSKKQAACKAAQPGVGAQLSSHSHQKDFCSVQAELESCTVGVTDGCSCFQHDPEGMPFVGIR